MLVEALKLEDGPERETAVNNLMVLSDPGRTVVPKLRDFLASEEERDRTTAAAILGRIGGAAAALAPELVALAREREALGEDGPCPFATALQEIGWSAWPAVSEAAAGEAVAELRDGHWAMEFTRVLALSGTAVLAEALADARAPVRLLALCGLESVARQARFAYDKVAAQLDDSEAAIRARALRTAAAMRPEGRKLHALLQRGFEDTSAEVRAAAVAGVQSLDSDPEVSLPLLLTALADSNADVQREGIRALGAFGAQAAIAVGLLRERVRDGNPEAARIAALEALASIGPDAAEALPEIAACIEHGGPELRSAGLTALGAMGAAASEHGLLVEAALEAPEPAVRAAALAASVRLEPEKEKLLPRLEQALADPAPEVRRPAIEALGSIGEPARPAAGRLFSLLVEGSDRPLVLSALREIRPRDVALYLSVLEHPEAEVRRFACAALGRMGKDAAEAAPQLRERLRDEYDFVRDAARQALRRIEDES
jgi:HEAT repeat protein